MHHSFEKLATKAKANMADLFILLGDAGTLERSHRLTVDKLTSPLPQRSYNRQGSSQRANKQT